jgi:hypothetical protein
MPITLQCTCGQQFKVPEDLAGRRVKCPGCQQVVAVPGGSSEEAPAEPEERERGKGKKKEAAQAGNKKMWIIAGSIGGAVLLLGCCCVGGIGGYFLFLAGPGDPEMVIVGKWTLDVPFGSSTLADREFKSDGSYSEGLGATGTWRKVNKTGDTITVDITTNNIGFPATTRTFEIKVLGSNSIEIRQSGSMVGTKMRRA